jgi:HSP20 family protein
MKVGGGQNGVTKHSVRRLGKPSRHGGTNESPVIRSLDRIGQRMAPTSHTRAHSFRRTGTPKAGRDRCQTLPSDLALFRCPVGGTTEEGRAGVKTLVPRDTFFNDLFELRRDFDDMFTRMLPNWSWWLEKPGMKTPYMFAPPVETYIDKEAKKYFCRVWLPGIEPKDFDLHVHGNTLIISGERKHTYSKEMVDFKEQEFVYGRFERTVVLPEGVNFEKLTAEYVNGVLIITAPVLVAALPRRIEVKHVPVKQQIAA